MELAAAPLLPAALAWVLALAVSMAHKALTVSATPRHPSPEVQSTMLMANLLAPAQELVLGPRQVATTAMALAWAQALVTMAVEWAVTRPTTLQVGFLAYSCGSSARYISVLARWLAVPLVSTVMPQMLPWKLEMKLILPSKVLYVDCIAATEC